tara:strand:- start:345 stop:533 length:189 start_codon:yes stop_codon:yes gene_type:complete
MAKSKKKVAPKKKVAAKKVVTKKVEAKPTEVKATPTFIEIPYVPRKIDRVPPPEVYLKKQNG